MPNAVRFAVTPLTPVSELEAHISTNEARGLPEAVPEPATAFLCASGPSLALDGPESFWAAHEARPEVPVIAVNGALGPLLARDVVPTFWAACDGAEKVADFLTEAPAETIYLVASRCHPKVFERLKGRLVRVWRLDDERRAHYSDCSTHSAPAYQSGACDCGGLPSVQHAISVTLCAQNLLRLMGFGRVECWGWDGCNLDGRTYADGAQGVPALRNLKVGSQDFATTSEWMAEMRDAEIQARNWKAMGYQLAVHGPGAMGAVLRARGLIG